MQRALDARPVVIAERPDAGRDKLEILRRHRRLVEDDLIVGEASLRLPAEVEHDLEQQALVIEPLDRPVDVRRERQEEQVQLCRIGGRQPVMRSPQFVDWLSHTAAPAACP